MGRSKSTGQQAKRCVWYKNKKGCREGANCPFWHPGFCQDFKNNRCHLGDKCVFHHGPAPVYQAPAQAAPAASVNAGGEGEGGGKRAKSPSAKAAAKAEAKAEADLNQAQKEAADAQRKAAAARKLLLNK